MLEKDIEEKVKVLTKQLNGSEKIQSETPNKVEIDNRKSTSKGTVIHSANNYISHKKSDEDIVVVGTEPEKLQPVQEITEIAKNIGVKKGEKTNNLATIDEKVTNNENGDHYEVKIKTDGFEYDETNKNNKSKTDNNIVIQTEEQSDPAELDPVFQSNEADEPAIDDLGTKPNDVHLSEAQAQHSNHALPKKLFSTNPIQGTRNNSYAKFASAKKVMEQEKLKLKQILHSIDLDSAKQVQTAPKFNELKNQPSSFTSGELSKMKEVNHSIERILKAQIKHHGNMVQPVTMPSVQGTNSSINNSAAEDGFLQPSEQENSQICEY